MKSASDSKASGAFALGLLVVAGLSSNLHAAPRVLAATGTPAPGTTATFVTFGVPAINLVGQVSFRADISSGQAVFRGAGVTTTVVAQSGQAFPGAAGVTFASFDDPLISDSGRVAFTTTLAGPVNALNNRAVAAGEPGNVEAWARTGNLATGAFNDDFYFGFDTLRLSPAGKLVVFGTLVGEFVDTTNNLAIWAGTSVANFAPVARTGDLVTALPGTLYTTLGIPTVNAAGQVAFTSIIVGGGVNLNNDQVIFRTAANGIPAVALREGMQAAGAAAGVRYATFGTPSLNASGAIAVSGSLRGTGVTSYTDTAAWNNVPGAWQQLVRSGDAAPGVLNGNISVPGFPRINASGAQALISALTGASINADNDIAVWTNAGGPLTLVARKGVANPALPAGVVVASFDGIAINAQGTILMKVSLTGAGVSAANNSALLAWDRAGTQLVARTGGTLDVGGVAKTFASFRVALDTGAQEGRPSSLSERGQVVYAATFTDNSQALVTVNVSRCSADIAGVGGSSLPDGQQTVDDLIEFVNAYSENSSFADIVAIGGEPGADGQLTVDDLIGFVNAFSDGCPL